jgi:hypothetical protein
MVERAFFGNKNAVIYIPKPFNNVAIKKKFKICTLICLMFEKGKILFKNENLHFINFNSKMLNRKILISIGKY